jgi:hypothetical protein
VIFDDTDSKGDDVEVDANMCFQLNPNIIQELALSTQKTDK